MTAIVAAAVDEYNKTDWVGARRSFNKYLKDFYLIYDSHFPFPFPFHISLPPPMDIIEHFLHLQESIALSIKTAAQNVTRDYEILCYENGEMLKRKMKLSLSTVADLTHMLLGKSHQVCKPQGWFYF